MSITDNIKNIYRDFRVRRNPLYVLEGKDLPTELYLKALGVTHEYRSENDRIVSKILFERMTGYFPGDTLRRIQCEIIRNHPQMIDRMQFIDLEPCKLAADLNPDYLKRMYMEPMVQEELYESDKRLLQYMTNEPSGPLQSAAIRDDWKNIFRFENLNEEGKLSFLVNTLGVSGGWLTKYNYGDLFVAQGHEAEWNKIDKALTVMLIKWEGIESDYVNNDFKMLPADVRESLQKYDMGHIPESMRDEIYIERYTDSLIEFQRDSGLSSDPEAIEKMKVSDNKELFRRHALWVASRTDGSDIRTFDEIVRKCAENQIIRKKTSVNSYSGANILEGAEFRSDEFESLVKNLKEREGRGVLICKEFMHELGVNPALYTKELHDELVRMIEDWNSIEKTGCVMGDTIPLDTDYIVSAGCREYPQEFQKALYKQSYKATVEDFRSMFPLINFSMNSPVVNGIGFKDDKAREEGITEGIKLLEPKIDGTLDDIYLDARKEALNTVRDKYNFHSPVLSNEELVSLRQSLRNLDRFGGLNDVTPEQMASLIDGRSIDVGNKGSVFRQKTVGGGIFRSIPGIGPAGQSESVPES